jgi:two-component sensor histidine kinase
MDQAVLLGLIVNELVTNAIKHAFPDERAGHVRVALQSQGSRSVLTISDDGIGLAARSQAGAGMGQELVHGLAHQLGAEVQVKSSTDGTCYRLSIPYENPVLSAEAAEPSQRLLH